MICGSADLQALETLVLRCPAEMATAINPILNRALKLVKYDPVSFNPAAATDYRTMSSWMKMKRMST